MEADGIGRIAPAEPFFRLPTPADSVTFSESGSAPGFRNIKDVWHRFYLR